MAAQTPSSIHVTSGGWSSRSAREVEFRSPRQERASGRRVHVHWAQFDGRVLLCARIPRSGLRQWCRLGSGPRLLGDLLACDPREVRHALAERMLVRPAHPWPRGSAISLHEVKHDGHHIFAFLVGGSVRLRVGRSAGLRRWPCPSGLLRNLVLTSGKSKRRCRPDEARHKGADEETPPGSEESFSELWSGFTARRSTSSSEGVG